MRDLSLRLRSEWARAACLGLALLSLFLGPWLAYALLEAWFGPAR